LAIAIFETHKKRPGQQWRGMSNAQSNGTLQAHRHNLQCHASMRANVCIAQLQA
jgi:hypothetical protein